MSIFFVAIDGIGFKWIIIYSRINMLSGKKTALAFSIFFTTKNNDDKRGMVTHTSSYCRVL
ncbi:hypothetical protein PEC302110_26890 [Pectobacterium araliae]|uniref:Uncharacterized protein n=1 Tax=Pectobacterium araliae TaxID=3073862 RepID=A0AAN0MLN8_9GAMM|nr:hypothetical protein PEC302110_26890 [Pectobacterium sp. MAFF 302110]